MTGAPAALWWRGIVGSASVRGDLVPVAAIAATTRVGSRVARIWHLFQHRGPATNGPLVDRSGRCRHEGEANGGRLIDGYRPTMLG